ncbi:hypothetical protein ACFX13_030405 [Malus domestica]
MALPWLPLVGNSRMTTTAEVQRKFRWTLRSSRRRILTLQRRFLSGRRTPTLNQELSRLCFLSKFCG